MEINKQSSLSLVYNAHKASQNLKDHHNKLSSGRKLAGSEMDTGSYGQLVSIENEKLRKIHTVNNLQNLISYSQSQLDALHQAGEILTRMHELARLSIDITKTDKDRSTYNHEFLELANGLEDINQLSFNKLELFTDGPFSDEKKQFIEVLQSQWLKAAETVIEERLGLVGTGLDTFKVNVNDQGNENYSISLSWNYSDPSAPDKSVDVASLNFEIYNYNLPISGPSNDANLFINDRLNAVIMTYAVLAENLYFNALANGSTKVNESETGGAEWFKSGVADFVHGGDFLLEFSGGFSQSTIDAIGSGDEQASTLQQRASYYAAVRFLHHELKEAGQAQGVKDMLQWMSTGVKNGLSSKETSIGGALQHFFGSSKYTDISNANEQFIQHFKDNALSFHNDSSNSFEILLNNSDTGAIGGADADPDDPASTIINHQGAVPDSGPGYDPTPASTQPFGNFGVKWEKEGEAMFTPNEDGKKTPFPFTNSFTVDDKESYNLKTKSSAKLTLSLLDSWTDAVNEQKSTVSANFKSLSIALDQLRNSIYNHSRALGRISDTDYATEATALAKTKLKAQTTISILSKGMESKFSVGQLLQGVKVSKKL
ncbi:MAG: flagellin [Verrucomicrobiota bacterium]|nr:flagellin [Verrucomicrobiota bacterium]